VSCGEGEIGLGSGKEKEYGGIEGVRFEALWLARARNLGNGFILFPLICYSTKI